MSNDHYTLQVAVAQLYNAHASLQHDLSNLRESMHLADNLITNYTHPIFNRVISDKNRTSHKALAIGSLSSVTIRNRILSVGKRLKDTGFYVQSDLPKEVQISRKLLRPFFLAARVNNEQFTYIGTRLRISNTIFGVNDTASLTIRYPYSVDKPKSLNP